MSERILNFHRDAIVDAALRLRRAKGKNDTREEIEKVLDELIAAGMVAFWSRLYGWTA